MREDIAPGRWVLRGRSLRYRVEIEAAGDPAAAHILDVPVPAERRTVPWSHQHLAGRLHVRVTRHGRLMYEGESDARRARAGPRAVGTPKGSDPVSARRSDPC